MSKMMICPNWRECKEYCQRKAPHKCSQLIGDGTLCKKASWKRDECNNTCIPYIPEQEYECTNQLLNCKDGVYACEGDCESCHYWQPKKPATCPDQVCKFCGRPSIDWDEECVEGFHEAADIKPSEMPLVKNLITYPPDIAEALEVGKIRQQRADMAWHKEQCKECIGFPCPMEAHDSAVASKARQFLVAKIIGRYADTLSPEAIRDIRAMAEGEE